MGNRKQSIINIVGISIMAILLSLITQFDITSLSFFSPTEKSVDFQSSDFYQQVAHSRDERILDDRIVIIPIDNMSRKDIALLIDDISQCSPLAIGLDVIFQYTSDDDSLLYSVFSRTPSLILPIGVYEDDEGGAKWKTMKTLKFTNLGKKRYGVANMNIQHPYNVVRSFIPFFETDAGVIPNFVVSLSSMADSSILKETALSETKEVYINYPSREFEVIPPSNLFERYVDIENKIVLLGALSEAQDLHITPIDDSTPGVMIHAYALSTIIHKDYLKIPPKVVVWILGLLLCLIFVSTNAFLNRYSAGNMLMRLFQLAMLFMIIIIGCLLFIKYNLVFELSFPLLLVALGIMALDFWNGIISIITSVIKNIKKNV